MEFAEALVSGIPEKIYAPMDGLYEFHDKVMEPDRAKAAGIDYLFELYKAGYYRRTADLDMMVDPAHPWSIELVERYNTERHCHMAASVVLRIDDAVMRNSVIHCRAGDAAFILYESYRFPDRLVEPLAPAAVLEAQVAEFQDLERCYLYLGSAGSFNYGHWLVDDLPRAKAWLELRARLGITCIVVLPAFDQKIDEVRARSLRMLIDPLIEIRFVPPDRPCRLKNLYYASPVSYHPRVKNPSAIHFVRSQAIACQPDRPREPDRKLFVARRPPNSRAIVNFDALWAFLAARGFEMVEAESMDFAGQVALFRDARFVVGQMGAAMTSTLFCRPATNLVYLAPIGWAEPFYLDLAMVGGQQYNILPGPATDAGAVHLSDFEVPIDHLYHRLTYMGLRETA